MNKYYYVYKIDDYIFTIGEDDGNIIMVSLGESNLDYNFYETELIKKTKLELEEYFSGKRVSFDIPIKLTGTDFQNKVWRKMQNIKYGEVVTYKELARRCGNIKACRAIGNVCNKNKILILIPCHRVVASNGLGGFGCGIDMKIKLLEMEGSL